MEFDFSGLSTNDRYKLMTSAITPRPIAWVTTQSTAGLRNAAPFSFFNMMTPDPPLVALGLMLRPDGTHKDSAANILGTGELVINLVSYGDAAAMNLTCVDAPPGLDELEMADIAVIPSTKVGPPRIASAPVSLECRLFQDIRPGQSAVIILGEVLAMHVADSFIDGNTLHVDTPAMDLIGRLHGAGWYARSCEPFQMHRPVYAAQADKP